MTSPTQRTLAELKRLGYTAAIVERWNPYAKVRQDLYGWIDVLALKCGEPLLAVQATSGANHAARMEKARALSVTGWWLSAGCRGEVWSWSKRGKRGKRKVWTLRREELSRQLPSAGRCKQ